MKKVFCKSFVKYHRNPPAMGNLLNKVADLGNFQESYPIQHLRTAAFWDEFLRSIFFSNSIPMISSVKIIRSYFFTLLTRKPLCKFIAQYDKRSSYWQVFCKEKVWGKLWEGLNSGQLLWKNDSMTFPLLLILMMFSEYLFCRTNAKSCFCH